MKLKIAKYPNTCLLASFAMALDVDQEDLIKEIGHDGSRLIWSDMEPPNDRIGHHPQELIDCCLVRGVAVTLIERQPKSGCQKRKPVTAMGLMKSERRFFDYLEGTRGVVITETHACAFENYRIFDPCGSEYTMGILMPQIKMAFLLNQIKI